MISHCYLNKLYLTNILLTLIWLLHNIVQNALRYVVIIIAKLTGKWYNLLPNGPKFIAISLKLFSSKMKQFNVVTPTFVVQHYTWSKCEQFYLQMDQSLDYSTTFSHVTRYKIGTMDSSCIIDLLRALYAHCTYSFRLAYRWGLAEANIIRMHATKLISCLF